MDLSNFEEAVRDYEKAYKLDKNRGNVYFLVVLLLAFVYI